MKRLNGMHGGRPSFFDLFWMFVFGSVAGYFLEGVWHVLRTGAWEHHVSTVWGPFCTVYGIAAALLYAMQGRLRRLRVAWQFVIYAVVGSLVELLTGVFQRLAFGSSSWNYDAHAFNLGGYISLQMTLLWGVLGISFSYFIFPYFSVLLKKMRGRACNAICICLFVFMMINLAVSGLAVMRWGERIDEKQADTPLEELFDRRFGDDRMKRIYPNMIFD